MTIPRIVLTGGPCAGKTSALARLRARLETYGRRVFTTAEASTLLLDGGAFVTGTVETQQQTFQRGVLRVTMALEDALLAFARGLGEPAVLICDRGVADGGGYLHHRPDLWQAIVAETGQSEEQLRDGRYDVVMHLITAADGADRFYGNENNPGRYEDAEGARECDRQLRRAWSAHPRQIVIDNSTDFDEKLRRVVAAVCAHVGIPGPGLWERKFVVHPTDGLLADAPLIHLEQTYLASGPDETRVRKSSLGRREAYTLTTKKATDTGRRVEIERPITLREYNAHLENADPACRAIRKRRRVLRHAGHYFLLDEFLDRDPPLWLLEVEFDDPDAKVEPPPSLRVEREVTGDEGFLNRRLARR